MLNFAPNPDRWRLGFKGAVVAHFGFLGSHRLKPVEALATFVRFESDQVFVNVYHGRASYELGIEIGRIAEPHLKYSLTPMAEIVAPGEKVPGHGALHDAEVISRLVAILAANTQHYATPFLDGEKQLFMRLAEIERARAREYWHSGALRVARGKAENARMAKDYAAMVEAYGSIEADLTLLERKRLTYARGQILLGAQCGQRRPR